MVRLALSVMLVSGGLAAIARAIEGRHGTVAGPLLLVLGGGAIVGGLILVALERIKWSPGARRRSWSRFTGWDEASELDRMTEFEAAWERSQHASEPLASINGARMREASRSLLSSFERDTREAARSRSAVRSACRRSHVRAAASQRPKRHRVRPRARVFM